MVGYSWLLVVLLVFFYWVGVGVGDCVGLDVWNVFVHVGVMWPAPPWFPLLR